MNKRRLLPLIFGLILAAPAGADPVDTAKPGEQVERHLSGDQTFQRWSQDPALLDSERGDRLEVKQVVREKLETVKLKNVVPPIRFESGVAKIPPSYVDKLAKILESMRYRRNVRVHFVGHADTQPLSDALVRVFGDNAGLSRERAGEVAEYFKNALKLPPEAVTYEWAGETQPIASNLTEDGRALNRRVEVEVWYDEVEDALKDQEVVVSDEIKRIKVCRMETVCKLRYKEGHARRARVKNLVVPLRYEDETTPISEDFTKQVLQSLYNLRDKERVTVRFIGYTDDAPLTGRDERIYGNHLSLSKARALRVALAMQESLGLPTAAVESDGRGASHPAASNETVQGRTLNRRVEVEFWHDDPLQELPEEPQLCPSDGGAEMVTKVYDPPWGRIATLELVDGQPIVPPGYAADLNRALSDIANRTNARLRFIGYTKDEHLDRRTASVYGDDIGLSAARARRAMDIVTQDPLLSSARSEHEGRGFVQSDDVVNAGFIQGERSFVRVQVVYDELVPLDDYEGVDITRITRELQPKSPYELNVMRITVDGKPIDDPGRSSSDVQRCTDVALDDAKILFRFDNLESKPRLGVAADPTDVAVSHLGDGPVASAVRFRMYDNYASFIERAEIRIFGAQQSLQAAPLATIAVDGAGLAEWQPAPGSLAEPERELKYVLRAYDAKGRFDETEPRPLSLYREVSPTATAAAAPAEPVGVYGESDLARQRIPLVGGTVKVQGSGIPAGHTVWVAGRQVPVDPQGSFAAEEILPDGAHTVEVAVLDDAGNGSLYLRDLEFKPKDLFFVAMADLTVSENRANGPAELLQGENAPQPYDSSLDGRLAFYLNGKISENWRLTASADTREGPVQDLFSNFLDKTPDSLFRRIDYDYFWPTFGDDGVVEEMAPTLGKFYVKASRGENYGMWGNFKIGYMDNELAQVDRGLYGANAHYGSEATTSFGERRGAVDGFAADPGTVPSYEEFRGTGGSLYFLHHVDILQGSERVRIEVRDKDSRVVTGVVNLRPGIDYDIDYLQGRLLLSAPLSWIATDNLLVRSSGVTGDEAFVVARYEYTPGFDDLDAVAVGGQGHYWFNDHVRLGLTGNTNDDGDADSSLGAADLTLRMSTESWLKVQAGRSEGLVSSTLRSDDGGFRFAGYDDLSFTDAVADAYRGDLSFGIGDFFKGHDGRATLYMQNVDAGYSAPGQATIKDTERYGGTFRMPVSSRVTLAAKGDQVTEDQGLETRAIEVDLAVKVTDKWSISGGVRNDLREDHSPVVPATQEQGERTDAVVQAMYQPSAAWRAYGFVQGTIAADEGREDNGRIGAGGSYRASKRFSIDGEVSGGDLGPGGRIGTSFQASERTNLYLNYSLDNERMANGLQWRRGNLVSGMKTRLSDASSVYLEERYQNGGPMTGLTHATGINVKAKERWSVGANAEFGTLRDSLTSAETDRKAAGFRVGYAEDEFQFQSAVEYRRDDAELPDTTHAERTAWLFRNNFKLQLTPDWRMVGKLDHSFSDSSLGEFYNGGYTEVVIGYAYRPVRHDRWSALAKYTFFYNVPTQDQLGAQNTPLLVLQKSHIAALDLTYDISAAWSIGGKVAYRLGQVSLDRAQPAFFDNAAALAVLRVDWKFLKGWESLVEGRMLDLPDMDQRRVGALAAVYRYFGEHLKAGVGYNFTDFSDDLTDLSYDHQGVFLNVIGTW